MPLARLYDRHAEECARASEQTEDPKHRALLLMLADQWRQDAQRLRQGTEGGDASPAAKARPRVK
jgi:hypothetical protein